jgi:hypothetical protein
VSLVKGEAAIEFKKPHGKVILELIFRTIKEKPKPAR